MEEGTVSEREAQREFDDLLHSELWQLPRHAMGVSFPHGDLASWRLRAEDERALRYFGVPVFEPGGGRHGVQLVGDVQSSEHPVIDSAAGPVFRLGTYWGRSLGVLEGTGEVVAVPAESGRPVAYVNSGARPFVETAWRWGLAIPVLRRMDDYEQLYDSLERFHKLACALDPQVAEGGKFGWWPGIIGSW
ncbi:SUKH-4 family immunity protein [Streptomyces sp. NPDC052773]|uniref:SUKH-4 family immunity protein n=1 Tax=Streptomyces sp. NPDC052773 TaxID=3365693 RepID=UPI0037D4D991